MAFPKLGELIIGERKRDFLSTTRPSEGGLGSVIEEDKEVIKEVIKRPRSQEKISLSITEARKRGANDTQILEQIREQNPQKSDVFDVAIQRGANTTQIVDEIFQQNKPSGTQFLKRLGLSFGEGKKAREFEESIGKRGEFEIGDIADVAGGIPALGGLLGGAALGTTVGGPLGGLIGGALGAGGGEFFRQLIGKVIGTREEFEPEEVALEATFAGIGGVAAKALGPLAKQLARALPERLVQNVIKQSIPVIKAGKSVTDVVLNKPIKTAAGMLAEVTASSKVLNKQIKRILGSRKFSKEVIRPQDIYTQTALKFPQSGITAKEVKAILVSRARIVSKDLRRPRLNLQESNTMRSIIDNKVLKSRAFLTTELPFNQDVVKAFNNILRETVKTKAPTTRNLFDTLSKEIDLNKALESIIAARGKTQIVKVRDILPIGLGFSAYGIPGILIGQLAGRALGSAPAKVGAAKLSRQTGRLLERGLQIPGAERGAGASFFELLRGGRNILQ